MKQPIERRIEKLEAIHNPKKILIWGDTQADFEREVDARIARGILTEEDRAWCIRMCWKGPSETSS
jgi:hypothetical protein